MTNLKDLSETLDNFVRKMRTVVRLDRLGETETTNDVMIYEIGCVCCSSCLARTNFRPPREGINCNTNILKTKLVSGKRTSEINSPMSEDVEDCNGIVWKPLHRTCTCKLLTGHALCDVSTDKLVHQGKPKTSSKGNEGAFHATVTSTIVCDLKGLFASSIRICHFADNTATLTV